MIRLEGVQKSFGRLRVLDGVDLDVARGRVTAIVGPNGSGKTTLLKSILGLVKPDAGRIVWEGTVLNGDWRYRERVGYMPQIVRFPENLTGRELIHMIEDLRGDGTDRDAELIEAFDLDPHLDKPFRTLSGGTRQKVNAAIAFRFGADLMILDEPTGGLDPVASRILKRKVRSLRDAGRTFLLTSHNMGELEDLSDEVAFLLDGKVRFHGTVDGIKERTGEKDLEGAIAAMMTRGDQP